MRILAASAVILLVLSGCSSSGVRAYRPVNLDGDLDATALARYRSAVEDPAHAGHAGHHQVIERTNWWPLGLVAYWRQGEVQAMYQPDGTVAYMVSESHGYGPLSVLCVGEETVVFDAEGRRLSSMSTGSILWGHLAMLHGMGYRSSDGAWHTHKGAGLLHHLINVTSGHGEKRVSFFSGPNPAGFGF